VCPVGPVRRWASSGASVSTDPTPSPNPVDEPPEEASGDKAKKGDWKGTAFKMAESALTTFASVTILA